MIKITDEILMSYSDGELEKDEIIQVEKVLANDASLREKVTCHHALRTEFELAFHDVDKTTMPEGVLNLLREDNTNVVSLNTHKEKQKMKWWQPTAVAASIAAAFYIGMISSGPTINNSDFLIVDRQVAQLLDNTPTGTSVMNIVIHGSYLKDDGSLCRTFQDISTNVPTDGLSCRETNGDWKVIALLPGVPTNAYIPASGEVESIIGQLTDSMQKLSVSEEIKYLR